MLDRSSIPGSVLRSKLRVPPATFGTILGFHEGEGGADTRIRTEDLLFTKQLLYR